MFGFFKKETEPLCPRFKVPCLQHGCTHYQKIRGNDPQSGKLIDKYMCADLWNNVLTIENTGQQMRTAEAIEDFRNKMLEGNAELATLLTQDKTLVGK